MISTALNNFVDHLPTCISRHLPMRDIPVAKNDVQTFPIDKYFTAFEKSVLCTKLIPIPRY